MNELVRLCEAAASFYARGYAFGSTGNLSVRVDDDVWITPTGQSLRALRPEALARIGMDGSTRNANRPSKEYPFHLGAYVQAGGRARAIVHLHCHHAVALSCLAELNESDPLPVITPYYLMRVAPLKVVDYYRPGSAALAEAISRAAREHDAILLRNHGVVCLGATIDEAVDRTEELEETARLYFTLRGLPLRSLSKQEQQEIREVFPR